MPYEDYVLNASAVLMLSNPMKSLLKYMYLTIPKWFSTRGCTLQSCAMPYEDHVLNASAVFMLSNPMKSLLNIYVLANWFHLHVRRETFNCHYLAGAYHGNEASVPSRKFSRGFFPIRVLNVCTGATNRPRLLFVMFCISMHHYCIMYMQQDTL